jgi:hypothetical protein
MKPFLLACFLLLTAIVAFSCGDKTSGPAPSTSSAQGRLVFAEEAKADGVWPDGQLRKAFMAYWEAALDGRLDDSYEQEAAYVRQLVSREKYLKVMEFQTDAKKVTAFEVGAPRARSPYLYEVPLKMKMPTPAQGLPQPSRLDYWVKTDSGWHHAVKASLLFPELGFARDMPWQPEPMPQGKEVKAGD